MKRNDARYLIAVAVACLFWGGSIICSKLSYESLAPMSLGLIRFSLSTMLFFVLLGVRHELHVPPRKELGIMAASGLLGTSLYFAAENYGSSLASGATASLVVGSFPAMTLVLEAFVDHKIPKPRTTAGIVLAFVGVCLLAAAQLGSSGRNELLGIVVLMAGGVCWAIYNIMMRWLAGKYSPLVITSWQTLFGALGFIPLALIEHEPVTMLSTTSLLALGYLVTCCTVAGFSLYNYGFERLSPTVVSSLVNLVPVVGLALSAIILGEHISMTQLLGGAIVVTGIAISSLPEDSATA